MSGSGEGTGDWGGSWDTVTGTPGVTRTSGWGGTRGFFTVGSHLTFFKGPFPAFLAVGWGLPGKEVYVEADPGGGLNSVLRGALSRSRGGGLYATSGSGCPRSMVRSTGHIPVPSTLGLGSQNQKTAHTHPPPPQVSWPVILGHSPQLFAQHLKKLRPRQQSEWRGPHTASPGRASGWLSPAVLPRQRSGRAGRHPPTRPPSPCCCHEWS